MSLDLSPGSTVIPRHELRAELGVGEFGRVWSAVAPGNVLKALKFIEVNWSDPDRALREYHGVRRMRDVRGTFLVPLTDIWLLSGDGDVLNDDAAELLDQHLQRSARRQMGRTMVASIILPEHIVVGMELCERTLTQELESFSAKGKQGIPVRDLLRYTRDAARGLDFLHQKQHPPLFGGDEVVSLSHGDIKPDNIMLTGGGAKLCDFTLAEALQGGADYLRTEMTKPAGTQLYMAPEILRGERGHTSDLYSLAVTYYQLRTGQLPFTDEALASGYHLQNAKLKHEFSFRGIPDAELRVLKRATNPNPKKRYKTCGDFADALDVAVGVTKTDPVTGASVGGLTWRPVAVLAAVIGLIVAGGSLLRPGPARPSVTSDEIVQALEKPGLRGLVRAIDDLESLPVENRASLVEPFVRRFEVDTAIFTQPTESNKNRRAFVEDVIKVADLLPNLDERSRESLSHAVRQVMDTAIGYHRRVIDGVASDGQLVEPNEDIREAIVTSRELLARVDKASNLRLGTLDKLIASVELQGSRLAVRTGIPFSQLKLPDPEDVAEEDRVDALSLRFLSDVTSRREAGQWPPSNAEDAKKVLSRTSLNGQAAWATWEGAAIQRVRDEVIEGDHVELAWLVDRELAAALVGPGAFGEGHLAAIAQKLKPLRGRPDFPSVLDRIGSAVHGRDGSWIGDGYRDALDSVIASERIALTLATAQGKAVSAVLKQWPTLTPSERQEATAVALQRLEGSDRKRTRLATIKALREEFAEEISADDSFLQDLNNSPLRSYADYVRALRLSRSGGRDTRVVQVFSRAYAAEAGQELSTDVIGSDARRQVATDLLGEIVVRLSGDAPPFDEDLFAHYPLTDEARQACAVYRRVSRPLRASASDALQQADAVWLAASIIWPSDTPDQQGAEELAARLLSTELANGRRGLFLLAGALSRDATNKRAQAAEELANALTALRPWLVDAEEELVRRRVLDPTTALADRLRKAGNLSAPVRKTLAAAYRILAETQAARAERSRADAKSAYDLYEHANRLGPTPQSEVEQGLALIYSTLWRNSSEQLSFVTRVGQDHAEDPDPIVSTGARICLGMAAIGKSRQMGGGRLQRAKSLRTAIDNLASAVSRLEPLSDDPVAERRLVSCLVIKATAHVEYSFYSESSPAELQAAIAAAENALDFDPKHVQALRAAGNAHEDLALYLFKSPSKNYQKAVARFEQANRILRQGLLSETVSIPARRDLVRARNRWLAAGLKARLGKERQADEQAEALLSEAIRVHQVVEAAQSGSGSLPDAAELLFFLGQGLQVCGDDKLAAEAFRSCTQVADPESAATGELWCAASIEVALRLRSDDPERAREIAGQVYANAFAGADSVWQAAALLTGDVGSTEFEAMIWSAPPGPTDRAAELQLRWATAKLPALHGKAEAVATDRERVLQGVEAARRAGLPGVSTFDNSRRVLSDQDALEQAVTAFDLRPGPAIAAKFGKAVLALEESLIACDKAELPPALWGALVAEPIDPDPLVAIALQRNYRRFVSYQSLEYARNLVWVNAFRLLFECQRNEDLIDEQLRGDLVATLRRSFRMAIRMRNDLAMTNRPKVEQLLAPLGKGRP